MFKQLFVIIIIAVIIYIALSFLADTIFEPSQKQQTDKIIIISVIGFFCFLILIGSRVWIKSV